MIAMDISFAIKSGICSGVSFKH